MKPTRSPHILGGLLLRAIMFALAFGAGIIAALYATKAPAKDYQHVICDDESDPVQCEKIHFWYLSARSNDRTSCCGIADAYWADESVKVTDKGMYLKITDRRDCEYAGIQPKVEEDGEGNYITNYQGQPCITGRTPRDGATVFVPKERIDQRHQGNPTGHVVVFISVNSTFNYLEDGTMWPAVICMFPGVGG